MSSIHFSSWIGLELSPPSLYEYLLCSYNQPNYMICDWNNPVNWKTEDFFWFPIEEDTSKGIINVIAEKYSSPFLQFIKILNH